jgi:two-component system, OmpR family, copper resistance phosphate regulon response regulator CusR
MRILIIEDETSIANFLNDGLTEEGFSIDIADNGKIGLKMALDTIQAYDIILLDWMLPGMNGIEVCRSIRQVNKSIPIIFLTAKDTVDDAVFGLETGANDYIRKPFSFEELLARIRVLLRSKENETTIFSAKNIVLDIAQHTVTRNGEIIELTQKEFALLEYLIRNKDTVCRRTRIIEKVWDIHFDYNNSVIDVYINALRNKLDISGQESLIKTVRGVGYKIESL